MNFKKQTYYPFNNDIETGIRIITLLDKCYPNHLDLTNIIYLDFLNIHYVDEPREILSLHPYLENIGGEISVRRKTVSDGLELLEYRGLVIKVYDHEGIGYKISENGRPFIDSLCSQYFTKLNNKAKSIIKEFGLKNTKELKLIAESLFL